MAPNDNASAPPDLRAIFDPAHASDMIPRRDIAFDLESTVVPRDWVDDCPYQTSLLAAMSMLFPEGERFFVDSVKQVRAQLEEPALVAAVTGFIGQEAMHGREHRALNQMLAGHGYPQAAAVERFLRGLLGAARRYLSPRGQLAITAALEHFTAILAEHLLADHTQQQELHATVRGLWQWHALEESEHKAVAFDVYRAAGGGYLLRVGTMLYTTGLFVAVLSALHLRLLAARGVLATPWRWRRGVRKAWLTPGYFPRLLPAYLDYFRPRFHPNDRDTTRLLATWRDALFGPNGALTVRAAA